MENDLNFEDYSKLMVDDDLDPNELVKDRENKINQRLMVKGTVSLTFFNYLIYIGDFIILIFTPIFLDLAEFGVYRWIYQAIPLITTIISFGLKSTAIKFITYYDSKNEQSKSSAIVYLIILITCGLSFLFTTVFMIFSEQISFILTKSIDNSYYVQLMAFILLFIPILVFNQFFIARYKFNIHIIGNFVGNLLRLCFLWFFLFQTRNISSFFYAGLIGQGFTFFFLLINIFRVFKKPTFSISLKEIFKYSLPLYLGTFFTYIKSIFYIQIFNMFVSPEIRDEQMGLLSYVIIFFNLVNMIYNTLNSVITVYYSTIIYEDNAQEEYTKITYQLSKIYIFISFLIGFGFMLISPLVIKILVTLFDYSELYTTGTITMILYGFYFLASTFYYIPPTLLNMYKKSYKIVKIKAFSVMIYLIGYFLFIGTLGMIGIPIGLTSGFLFYILLAKYYISKKFKIGFDRVFFFKMMISSIPIIISIPLLYFFTIGDQSLLIIHLVGDLQFTIPYIVVIVNISVILIVLCIFILLSRKITLFSQSDAVLFKKLFGTKWGAIIYRIFVKRK